MGRRRLWLITDQSRTAAVYVAWARSLAGGDLGVERIDLGRVSRPEPLRQKIGQLKERLRGFDRACDRALVLHDWEDDWEDEAARERMRKTMQAARNALAKELGVNEDGDHVRAFLVPPTTEGLYLLLAHSEEDVKDVLRRHIGRCARSSRRPSAEAPRSLDDLIRTRVSHGATPHEAPPPRKADVDELLRTRHDAPKVQLAVAVEAVLRNTVRAPPPHRVGCLTGLTRWLDRWNERAQQHDIEGA